MWSCPLWLSQTFVCIQYWKVWLYEVPYTSLSPLQKLMNKTPRLNKMLLWCGKHRPLGNADWSCKFGWVWAVFYSSRMLMVLLLQWFIPSILGAVFFFSCLKCLIYLIREVGKCFHSMDLVSLCWEWEKHIYQVWILAKNLA